MIQSETLANRIRGMFLGCAVGDALGLPAEGLSRRRTRKMFKGRWGHRLFLGKGMLSDDTEHLIFTAQALLASNGETDSFTSRLASSLRWWLAALPAGVGLATLKSIGRLWLGFPPAHSGVFSAGNGPAMRAAPIGAFHARRPESLQQCIRSSTILTHTDPRALQGAGAIARLTAWLMNRESPAIPGWDILERLLMAEADPEWSGILERMRESYRQELPVAKFADALGLSHGISGYIYHTVPVAIYAWLIHYGDFENTLQAVLNCGGDTDTVGAIAGALAGATAGECGIPEDWLKGILDWPRSTNLIRKIAGQFTLAIGGKPAEPVRYFWPGVVPRNLFFLLIVLAHGFRRLAPPY